MGGKSKITVPVKTKGRPKGSKNKKATDNLLDATLEARSTALSRLAESGPVSENAPEQLPEFLEIVEGQSYFASNKGRLTNQEIIDNGLEFACTTGNVWNYKFK